MPQQFDRRWVLGGAAASAVLAATGCSEQSKVACATSKTLTTGQKAARDGRAYVEVSGEADRSCLNCTFFQTTSGDCGTCAIDSLPANPAGFCNSWAAQEARLDPLRQQSQKQGQSA